MAIVHFSEDEVKAALPKPREGSTLARRWEMFSDSDGQYARGEEAAQFVHDLLVKVLTSNANPVVVDFSGDRDVDIIVDDLASYYGNFIDRAMHRKFGETFGFTDTEPRYHMSCFFRRLFGTDRQPAF